MNVTVSPTPSARRVGASSAGGLARLRAVLPLISRIVAAVGGGYALAALASVAVLALPVSRIQAVIGGMLGSFAVYAAAVVWASQWIEQLHTLLQAAVYLTLGVVWLLPLRRFLIWMETGRWG